MDVFIVYLIGGNQPISKLLNPNAIDIRHTYEEQFVGMTTVPIELELLLQTREELIETVNKKLTPAHKEFIVGFKKGQPDWSLLAFENIKELPSIKWKEINLSKMDSTSKAQAIKKLQAILENK